MRNAIYTYAVCLSSGVDDVLCVCDHRHMGDSIRTARAGIRTEKLKIAELIRTFEHVRAAELLADLRILLRPEQFKIVVINLLIAARNASAVPPALSLRRIGARDQRGAIKDVVLIPLLLTVRTADLRQRPRRRVRSNAIVHGIHLLSRNCNCDSSAQSSLQWRRSRLRLASMRSTMNGSSFRRHVFAELSAAVFLGIFSF